MRNLNFYPDNSFSFYCEVVKSKHNTSADPDYKQRVLGLNDKIQKLYIEFDKNFHNNSLEIIKNYTFSNTEIEDFQRLYSYDGKLMQNLMKILTTTDKKRVFNTCQNCTVSEINSFDHLIPRAEFPEFIVNPKNLFPSCTICNGYKGTVWRENSERLFLNLYIDILPKKQYLFVDISINDETIETNFYTQNIFGIDPELFSIISNHYTKLNLFQRFNKSSNEIITNLVNTINASIGKISLTDIRDCVIERNINNKIAFGFNFWKSILEDALVNDKNFMDRFII